MHRIALKPDRYGELAYLAANAGKTPKGLVEDWIKDKWAHREDKPIVQLDDKPICREPEHSEKPEKPKPKSKLNPKVIAQIKEAWVSTHNRSEISRQTGIERAKVSRYVIRLINDGELKE